MDVHSHYLPEVYLAAARAAGQLEPDGFRWPSWSATNHLAMMDQLGIEVAVLSVSSPGVHFGDDQRAAALARQVNEVGTSPPCWEQVSLGRPRPMLEFIFDTTRAVSDLIFTGVLERHPSIRFVVTHCGGALPLLGDRIEAFRRMASPP